LVGLIDSTVIATDVTGSGDATILLQRHWAALARE
jgi:hypothetical protein